ncbi:MAG: 4-alpha-glucanotransferase [Spirochaetaceae bacterium]|jgi:4-alpha-glucanotransferase|nr:4-alpha-glucanotransferase [Spirochaetaceae bacterium]
MPFVKPVPGPLYETRPRHAGVLLHITSLPGPYGIGDLGKEARDFADFLSAAGASLWQILPLGPTGYGNSPYAAHSSFAGNELLLSPELLAGEGFLTDRELRELAERFGTGDGAPADRQRVDYGQVRAEKLPRLKKAARRFLNAPMPRPGNSPDFLGPAGGREGERDAFKRFCEAQAFWLEDYALFQVLHEEYGDARWHTVWDRDLATRDPQALEKIKAERAPEILEWKALQYFFERQWRALTDYVHALGIRIIGDIPIFVAPDSADSWTHRNLFRTGSDGTYSVVSGVPPDYFSPSGQLWGNPVYDWEKMKAAGYRWWIDRIRRLLSQVDLFRIDHFRGFDAYWAVPAGNPTAEEGTWEQGPGEDFFRALTNELGELPVLAEDLGFMTEGVRRLRDSQGFPGMKVCQFGFEGLKDGILDSRHLFLPHNYGYPWVAYSGTHDNDTTAGWYEALGDADKKTVADYFNCLPVAVEVVWAMIRSIMASHAQYAIFPIQDLLGLGSGARMNTPATCGSENWSWRLGDITEDPARRFAALVSLYGR